MNLDLPPERDLPEPERMLGAILAPPVRRNRLVAALAVAACFAVLIGLGVWAVAGRAPNSDLADPPADGTVSAAPSSSTPSPSPTPAKEDGRTEPPANPSATTDSPTGHAVPPGDTGTRAATVSASVSAEAQPSADVPATESGLAVAPPRATVAPRAPRTSGPAASTSSRPKTPPRTGMVPATLPIRSTTKKPIAPSAVAVSVAGRTVQPRESGSGAYLYVQLRLCGSGTSAWAKSVKLDGSGPNGTTAENSAALATMAPVWTGERLRIASGQCLTRTTVWQQPSVAAANAGHTMSVLSNRGEVRFSA